MIETRPISLSEVRRRRFYVFGCMFVATSLLGLKWTAAMPTEANLAAKIIMTTLFLLTSAWISLFFFSSLFGFFELLRRRRVPGIIWPDKQTPLVGRTAVLMPIYNENPRQVFANLLSMAQSLLKTGQAAHYDIFVLSDTTQPKTWVLEESLWNQARRLMPDEVRLYYRRRPKNVARKSGNIEDFCHKWGALYDYMIVLDADSLLDGQTMVRMSQLMDANHETGIIQAPPICINSHSLFARIQQFAGRVYGPIVSSGLAYWQVGDSNYWGHNAIIRVKAFIDCCGLPVLSGRKPFGGHILSHDFVEAALIRRGGWLAWLLPELKGSYEECPPTMIDFAVRDRRWCQGNMQHLKVLISKRLHPISRIHFIIGVMSYLSSPLWLSFLVMGILVALGHEYFPPDYFSNKQSLFPIWPIFDKIGTIALFVISMFMLIFPKILGAIIYLKDNKFSKIGGFFGVWKSVGAEILFSALSAPIMMVFQSKFVWEIFTGQDVGWKTQNRGGDTSWSEACRRHAGHTLLGVVTTIVLWRYVQPLFYWMLPITVGLMLSIPLSVFSSRRTWGTTAFRHKWFVIPEEIDVPDVAAAASFFYQKLNASDDAGVLTLIADHYMLELHTAMLETNGPTPEFDGNISENARIKLDNYISYRKEPAFSRDEETFLLYNPEILREANLVLNMV